MISSRKALAIVIAGLSPVVGACSNTQANHESAPSLETTTTIRLEPNHPQVPRRSMTPQATIICEDNQELGELSSYFMLDYVNGQLQMIFSNNLVSVSDSAPQALKERIGKENGAIEVTLEDGTRSFIAFFRRGDTLEVPYKITLEDGKVYVSSLDGEGLSQSTIAVGLSRDKTTSSMAFYSEASQSTIVKLETREGSTQFGMPLKNGQVVGFEIKGNVISVNDLLNGLHSITAIERSGRCVGTIKNKRFETITSTDSMSR